VQKCRSSGDGPPYAGTMDQTLGCRIRKRWTKIKSAFFGLKFSRTSHANS
jgi:hypothetical protein